MIRLTDAGFVYPDGHSALSGVNVEFRAGEVTAIVGPNGAGKSTLARLVMGLLMPTQGTVEVDDYDTRTAPPALIRSLAGYAWQNPDNQLVCGIVEDDVAFGPENLGLPVSEIEQRVEEVLEVVGLAHLRSSSIHGLSSAQKQQIAVAGAMAIYPRYLILDEVTSRLDTGTSRQLLDSVMAWTKDRNIGIIMITHQLAEVLKADWVCRMEVSPAGSGHIAICDRPAVVLRSAKLSEGIFLQTPLYDIVYHLEHLGVRLAEVPDSVDGLVELLCR